MDRAGARRALRRIYPQIASVEFEAEWYGTIGMTRDNLPRFHRLDEGVFSFCGYNGRGIAPGRAGRSVRAVGHEDHPGRQQLRLEPVDGQRARRVLDRGLERGAAVVDLAAGGVLRVVVVQERLDAVHEAGMPGA